MKAFEAFEYIPIVERILIFAHPRWDLRAMTGSERQATPLLRGLKLTNLPVAALGDTPGAFGLAVVFAWD